MAVGGGTRERLGSVVVWTCGGGTIKPLSTIEHLLYFKHHQSLKSVHMHLSMYHNFDISGPISSSYF